MDIQEMIAAATAAYNREDYIQAAEGFARAAAAYDAADDAINAAEMRNNQSVALLQAGKAQEALDAAQPTIDVFTRAQDLRRLGIAWGNVAAALEALGKVDEALNAYQQSVDYLQQAGEDDLQAAGLNAIAALQLRDGKLQDSAFSMLREIAADPKAPWWQRLLRKIMGWVMR